MKQLMATIRAFFNRSQITLRVFPVLLMLLVIAFVLRIPPLLSKEFWFDEAFSYQLIRLQPRDLILATAADNHPPLFYLLLKGWAAIGKGVIFLRVFSLLFGVLSIYFTFRLGQLMFNQKTALIGAYILMLLPIHIYFSTEIRMYSLWISFVLLLIISFVNLLKNPGKPRPYWFILWAVLALYTHYFTVFILISLALYSLLSGQKKMTHPQLLRIFSGIFFLFAPWLWFIAQIPHPPCFCVSPLIGLPAILGEFAIGGAGSISLKTLLTSVTFPLQALFVATAIILTGGFLCGAHALTSRRYGLLFALLFLLPSISLTIFSAFWPVFSPRSFVVLVPVYALTIAYGLNLIKKPLHTFILGTITLLLFFVVYTTLYQTRTQEPLAQAEQTIKQELLPNDIIFHTSIFSYYPFLMTLPQTSPQYLVASTQLTPTTLTLTKTQTTRVSTFNYGRTQRIWLIDDVGRAYPKEISALYQYLGSSFILLKQMHFKSISITLYLLPRANDLQISL